MKRKKVQEIRGTEMEVPHFQLFSNTNSWKMYIFLLENRKKQNWQNVERNKNQGQLSAKEDE